MKTQHEQCPKCAANGRDNHKDNLAVYADGHAWCYSCGYYQPADKKSMEALYKLLEKKQMPPLLETQQQLASSSIFGVPALPPDIVPALPSDAFTWLLKYNIGIPERVKYRIGWSPSRQRVIFPFYDGDKLVIWTGRDLSKKLEVPKWTVYGYPHIDDVILGDKSQTSETTLVLVEDPISAIRVSNAYRCLPLFGAHITKSRITRLHALGYRNLAIWLDYDKVQKALEYRELCRQFFDKVAVVVTERDPKEYTTPFIIQAVSKALSDNDTPTC